MPDFKGIPIVDSRPPAGRAPAVPSGAKYQTPQGFTAIKDGVKSSAGAAPFVPGRKPAWLRAPLPAGERFDAVREVVHEHRLATVCEEAKCPNIGECWNAGTATLMLMGAVCTRACRFCAVDTGNPRGWLDADEPRHTAQTVELMRLKYVVLTSVNRDDLDDGGAGHFAACIREIRALNPGTAVEALTPDFQGNLRDVETVVDSGLDVFAQNVETVRRLTHPVRDPRAGYDQTLAVLAHAKLHRPEVLTKTSLMLGLGETDAEIMQTMDDLRQVHVDILTLGQYLQPTRNHLAIERWVTPQEFEMYRQWGLGKGFRECVSGPLVRSSYRAEQALKGNNVGLELKGIGDRDLTVSTCWRSLHEVWLNMNSSLPLSPVPYPLSPKLRWLGRVPYEPTWRAMQEFNQSRTSSTPDEIWFLVHDPVFTLGLNGRREHVLAAGDIPVINTDRGGQVTYHGPGQLVVYPLLDLKRYSFGVRDLVVWLENATIAAVARWGIEAAGRRDAPGVYVAGAKLASLGLRIKQGGSYHGLALNVALELEPFQRINPCGYVGLQVTQLSALGGPADLKEVVNALAEELLVGLGCKSEAISGL